MGGGPQPLIKERYSRPSPGEVKISLNTVNSFFMQACDVYMLVSVTGSFISRKISVFRLPPKKTETWMDTFYLSLKVKSRRWIAL